MKPKLRVPLRDQLVDGFGEVDVQRVWRGLRAPDMRARRPSRWYLTATAFALLSVCAVAIVLSVSAPSPLRLTSGVLPTVLAVDEGAAARSLNLADGSRLLAQAGTRLEVLANDGNLFLTALRRGRASFDVRPNGARRWIVECGQVTVEVVGTEFAIERTRDHVHISVTRGVVVVRGESVPDHVQRLGPGEDLSIATQTVTATEPSTREASPSRTAHAAASAAEDHAGIAEQESASPPKSVGSSEVVAKPVPIGAGRERLAPEEAGASNEVDELMRLAEAARRGGDTVTAVRRLEEVAERFRGTPAGAVATLTLARLTMATQPARAERALSYAIAAGMPLGLEEDARARLVEARSRSGDRDGARAAARTYAARFPHGVHTKAVEKWAE